MNVSAESYRHFQLIRLVEVIQQLAVVVRVDCLLLRHEVDNQRLIAIKEEHEQLFSLSSMCIHVHLCKVNAKVSITFHRHACRGLQKSI